MSFILESIKQAERERKLEQESPSIAIEYTGAHVEDIENNKIKWVILSAALFLTAMVVWGATYYFTNKDRQYMQQYVKERSLGNVNNQNNSLQASITEEKLAKSLPEKSQLTLVSKADVTEKQNTPHDVSRNAASDVSRNVTMTPINTLHKSDLKSVKLIEANAEPPKTKIEKVVAVSKPVTQLLSSKKASNEAKPIAIKSVVKPTIESATLADKQQLAEIYSDLSSLTKQKAVIDEPKLIEQNIFVEDQVADEQVQIETASYVTPKSNTETNTDSVEDNSPPAIAVAAPKHAVRTGVPSFGELPYDIQEKIPDFNVSVHMFHAEPNQRRIRINGNMYTEGKSLQQDLALVEITRYGAIFDYQGHKFRVNVR